MEAIPNQCSIGNVTPLILTAKSCKASFGDPSSSIRRVPSTPEDAGFSVYKAENGERVFRLCGEIDPRQLNCIHQCIRCPRNTFRVLKPPFLIQRESSRPHWCPYVIDYVYRNGRPAFSHVRSRMPVPIPFCLK